MADQVTLALISRTGVGSNATRKLRRQGLAPGNLFGHGESRNVAVDAHDFRMAVPVEHYGSQLVRLTLDGKDAGAALVKNVQVNTLSRDILNIDFQRVQMEDRVTVPVSVVTVGEPADTRAGARLEQFAHSVAVRCGAFDVPEQITVDVSNMHIGDSVHASELPLPPGVELAETPEEVVIHVAAPAKPVLEQEAAETEATGPTVAGGKQKDEAEGEA